MYDSPKSFMRDYPLIEVIPDDDKTTTLLPGNLVAYLHQTMDMVQNSQFKAVGNLVGFQYTDTGSVGGFRYVGVPVSDNMDDAQKARHIIKQLLSAVSPPLCSRLGVDWEFYLPALMLVAGMTLRVRWANVRDFDIAYKSHKL